MIIRNEFNPAETDFLPEPEFKPKVNMAHAIAFEAVATAQRAEDNGFSRSQITLCFSRALFYELAKYNANMFGTTVMSYASGEQMFDSYPVKVLDTPRDELSAYVSIATIK